LKEGEGGSEHFFWDYILKGHCIYLWYKKFLRQSFCINHQVVAGIEKINTMRTKFQKIIKELF